MIATERGRVKVEGKIFSVLLRHSISQIALCAEFEASHGTVSDLWHAHQNGKETSMNPLGLIEALTGAMNHAADLAKSPETPAIHQFSITLRSAIHNTFRYGQGTRDMAGSKGLTTEQFIDKVAWRLGRYVAQYKSEEDEVLAVSARDYVDRDSLLEAVKSLQDKEGGKVSVEEVQSLIASLKK